MDENTKIAFGSGAFKGGRSSHVGVAIDDTLIMTAKNGANYFRPTTTGPLTIFQKYMPGETSIDMAQTDYGFTSIHLPPQIKSLGDQGGGTFAYFTKVEEINLENVEVFGEYSCSQIGKNNGKTLVLHLDSAKDVRYYAFGLCTNVEIHLNEKVESVASNAFESVGHLYYYGELEGAPWGASEWN